MTLANHADDGRAWRCRRAAGLAKVASWMAAGAFAVTLTANGRAQNIDRQLRRPTAHSFLGSQSGPTTSFTERTVVLPEAGQVEFDYFVDSELAHDFFRVLDPEKNFTLELKDGDSAAICSTDDGYGYVIMPLARDR